jgi:hypothetical protein
VPSGTTTSPPAQFTGAASKFTAAITILGAAVLAAFVL